jgi:predicted ATPase
MKRTKAMHLNKISVNSNLFPTAVGYPFGLKIFHESPDLVFNTPVTFFVGENGSGKSTLLRALTRACGVHIWADSDKRRFEDNPYENDLHKYIDVTWVNDSVPGAFFSAELFNYFARSLDDWAVNDPGLLEYFGGTSLLSQSHGQSVMAFIRAQASRGGVYFLDEPETALSPVRQIELLRLLRDVGKQGQTQWIIATHSPILLGYPQAQIYNFNVAPLAMVDYESTDYFTVYRDFLADREKFLG